MEIDLYLVHQVLYMKVMCFICMSHFHLIIHLSHQRLFSAAESVTATPTIRELPQKTTGVPLWLFQRFCCSFDRLRPCRPSGWKQSHSVFDQRSRAWQDSPTVGQETRHHAHNLDAGQRSRGISLCCKPLYPLQYSFLCVSYADSTLCFHPLDTGRLPRKVNAIKTRTL